MISVIIPVFNKENSIEKTLSSILKDDNVSEIILIDDSSTDNSVVNCYSFIKNNYLKESIKLYQLDKNYGPSYARNYGVNKANNDIIAFFDADDIWYKSKSRIQIPLLKTKETIVIGNMETFRNNKYIFKHKKHLILNQNFEKDKLIQNILLSKLSASTPTIIMYKSYFYKIGGFDIKLKIREDHDFLMRAVLMGSSINCPSIPVAARFYDTHNYSNNVDIFVKAKSELKVLNRYKYYLKDKILYDEVISKYYFDIFSISKNIHFTEKNFKRFYKFSFIQKVKAIWYVLINYIS